MTFKKSLKKTRSPGDRRAHVDNPRCVVCSRRLASRRHRRCAGCVRRGRDV